MAIAILVGQNEAEKKTFDWFIQNWQETLLALDPTLDIRVWPNIGNKQDIDFLLVWKPPQGVLKEFPHVKAIASLAAGVDHVLADPELLSHVPLVRLTDPYMANDIVQYVTANVLNYVKRMDHWAAKQREQIWYKQPPFSFADQTIGVMGLGYLGSKAAQLLHQLGLKVVGFSNSPKQLEGITCYATQAEFPTFLSHSHLLVCLLPLTKDTRNILNRKTFAQLPKGAYLINVGRGEQLVEEDLLAALAEGQLSGACLDVFREEPLPKGHPFWTHPAIKVTPHIASVTNAATAAPQILENYRRALNHEPLLNQVNLVRGY